VSRGMAPDDVDRLKHLLRMFLTAANFDAQDEVTL
jgi:hypothetical protein